MKTFKQYLIVKKKEKTSPKQEKKKVKENLSYQIILTAPDGRFGTEVIEGGLDKKSALFEAKRFKQYGHVVKVFDKDNKKFIF